MDAIGRDGIVGEGCADTRHRIKRQRIINDAEQRRVENALLLFFGRRVRYRGLRFPDAWAFIGAEEKVSILANGLAECASKLVLMVRRRAWRHIKEVLRIQMVVAQEFVQAAMESVGARSNSQVDVDASLSELVGAVVACLNFEFLYRVDRRPDRQII